MHIDGRFLTPGERTLKAVLASALALALVSILVLEPEGYLRCACLFHRITGMSCLTCGLTRSLQAACRGDILSAVRFHMFGPVVFAVSVLAAMACTAEAFLGRRLGVFVTARRRLHALLGAAAIWFVYGVSRIIAGLV